MKAKVQQSVVQNRLSAVLRELADLVDTGGLGTTEISDAAFPVAKELPEEVSTAKAAEILGCSKDTVLKFKLPGRLEWRNLAPPGNCRPVYRFTLRSVLTLRTTYETDAPANHSPREPKRQRVRGERKYRHLDLSD